MSDAYTVLLLHSDTTDGDTTFVDSSDSGHTVTAAGNAQHSTAQAKFGNTSMYFDGNATTRLTLSDSSDFEFDGDFTIDFWVNLLSGSNGPLGFVNNYTTPQKVAAVWTSSGWGRLYIDGAASIDWFYNFGYDSWHHVAVVRSGTSLMVFVDGTLAGSATKSGIIGYSTNNFISGNGSYSGKGYIDELRVSKGIARWTENFTPPTEPYSSGTPLTSVRAALDQVYNLLGQELRQSLDQVYHLTERQINTLVQVYGLKMLATLIQPYGDMPRRRALLDQMYGDSLTVRRLLDQPYGDMGQYRAELDQQWVMLQDLRAELVQSYHIAADQVRAIFDAVYGLPEHDRVVALLDQLYVLAAGEAIVQQTGISIVVTTDGVERTIASAYNINIEQDDSIYHMTGELQLADQEDYLFCRAIGPGVAPSTVTVTIDGDEYSYIVERKQKARTTDGIAYAVVLASKTMLLGHKHAPESSIDETMLSGMAKTIVEALAADVCTVDWRLLDWYIPANRLYVNGRRRIEVIRQIVEAVGGILQSSPAGTLICRPEYPVDVDKWQQTTPDIELADQDNFFSIMPSADPRDGYNRFFIADQQLGESGERIDDEQVSTYERHVMVWYVPWADISGMRLHHSGGSWISVVEHGIASETVEEQIEIVDGQGRVSKPCYGDIAVDWLQQDLGAVSIEEDGTVTTEIAENSLALISYTTRYFSFNVRGDRVEDVQVYPEVIA